MRKALGIVLVLAVVFGVSGVWAAEVDGKIQKIDKNARMVTLDNGKQLIVAEGVSMDALKEGDKVKASYEEKDGKAVASKFQKVQ